MLRTINAVICRIARSLAISANIAGTLVVLALVGVVNFDVIARGAFNAPFLGAVEVVQFSMILIVFLQLPDVVRVNRLTRSDGFLVLLNKKAPRLTAILTHVIETISAVFMTLIAIAIWPEFIEMWQTRDYFGVPGVFTAPWWPIKLVIFLSTSLCALIFVLKVLSPAHQPELIRAPELKDLP
ncbi:MAG: TRAP transporter small permease subunit [Rhodobacteraceae bacterium]|nr:TRAP transporter small permease subunit [Paracoccaceae bacterium]